jgi:hypothetical protein
MKYEPLVEANDDIDEIGEIAFGLHGTANENLEKIRQQNRNLDDMNGNFDITKKNLEIADLKMKDVLEIVGRNQYQNMLQMSMMLFFLVLCIIFL